MTGDNLGNNCFLFLGLCPPTTVDLSNPSFTVPFTRPNPSAGFEFAKFFDYRRIPTLPKVPIPQLQTSVYDRVHFLAGVRLANLNITYNESALCGSVHHYHGHDQGAAARRRGRRSRQGAVGLCELQRGHAMDWIFECGFAAAAGAVQSGRRWCEVQFERRMGWQSCGIRNPQIQCSGHHWAGCGTARHAEDQKPFEPIIRQTQQELELPGQLRLYRCGVPRFSSQPLGQIPMLPAGNKLPLVTAHSGRLWANYKFDPGWLDGWSVGAGIYAASSQYVDNANLWRTDGYFTVDAKIGYARKGRRTRLPRRQESHR